jgi:hypothetical protein
MGKQINHSWYENLYIQQVEGKQSTSFSRSKTRDKVSILIRCLLTLRREQHATRNQFETSRRVDCNSRS